MRRLPILAAFLLVPSALWASTKASYMHYLKALLYSNHANYAEALREYEAALELDPQSAFMYQQAAELALELGRTDRALELAQRFAQLSPKNHLAYFLLGNVRWARGEWQLAQAAFEKTLEIKPDYKEALFALGNLLGAQNPELAKKYLRDYLAQNPDNAAEAEYQLALIEQKAGRGEDAVRHLRAAAKLDPDNPQPLYGLAQVYEVSQDTIAALGVYQEILAKQPRNLGLINHIGELYAAQGDPARAREQFLRVKSVQPDNPAACLWLGLLAEQEGDFEAAASYLKDSSDVKEDAAVNLRLSYYLTQSGRLKEAVEVLEAAHKKWPVNEDVTYFLALGYDDLKMTSKAVQYMQEVLQRRPEHRDARFQLAALYEKQGDIKNAELHFREILKEHPQDASALNYLGYSLADRGLKLEEAESLIRKAAGLDPNNGAYLDSLGWVHFKQARYGEARRELEAAARLLPDDDTLWDHLGDVYSVFGDTAAAWDSWKSSLLLAPDKTGVKDKLARLERGMAPAELGARYAQFLQRTLGKLAMFGGPCTIDGQVGSGAFHFQGIAQFKAPTDFSIEILGPLFVPVFRISLLGEDGFEMDPLRVPGVGPEVLRDRLYEGLRLVRAYLDGKVLGERPAELRKGWRSSSIETPSCSLSLDKPGLRLSAVKEKQGDFRLFLEDYRLVGKERWVPATLRLEGKGFSLSLRFPNPSARFE